MSETFPEGPEALQGEGKGEAVPAREVLRDGSGPAGPGYPADFTALPSINPCRRGQ